MKVKNGKGENMKKTDYIIKQLCLDCLQIFNHKVGIVLKWKFCNTYGNKKINIQQQIKYNKQLKTINFIQVLINRPTLLKIIQQPDM